MFRMSTCTSSQQDNSACWLYMWRLYLYGHSILISSVGWNVSIVTQCWWFASLWGWNGTVTAAVWSWEGGFSAAPRAGVLQKNFELEESWKSGGVYVDWNAALSQYAGLLVLPPVCEIDSVLKLLCCGGLVCVFQSHLRSNPRVFSILFHCLVFYCSFCSQPETKRKEYNDPSQTQLLCGSAAIEV